MSQKNSKELVSRFKRLYKDLDYSNCRSGIIESVYDVDMEFRDSFHQINGIDAFKAYCESLYQNLRYCEFDFHREWVAQDSAMLTWTMNYSHPRLKGGRNIEVEGATELRFNRLVTYHQDFFDGGNLLYEHVPLLGFVIAQLKKRMSA